MSGFDNDVMFAKNADFTQADNQNVSEANGLATNGQIWVGTTAVNAGGTHINVGTVVGGTGVTVTYSSPNIVVALTGGAVAVEHLTGNSGGQLNPDGSNNFNIFTANSTVKFAGSGSTLTQDFGITNIILGSLASSITSASSNVGIGIGVLNSLTSGGALVVIGASAAPLITTATNSIIIGAGAAPFATNFSDSVVIGTGALGSYTNSTNSRNTLIGNGIFSRILNGTSNVGIGYLAGFSYTSNESSNIIIQNIGVVGESNTLRIGTQGSSSAQQNKCFIAGIVGVTNSNAQAVTIDSTTGQLGITSADSSLVTTFTSSGTWTINSRTKSVEFFVWGGGGGGGSGRDGASGSAGGGAGGGPGSLVYLKCLASLLTASPYAVTIGTGGNGGIAVNATNMNGNPGNPGLPSSVGAVIIASGGTGGGGGTTASAVQGSGSFISLNALVSNLSGGAGNATTGGTIANAQYAFATGGGGGVGYTSATARAGQAGGTITDGNSVLLLAGGLAGSSAGGNGGNGNSPGSLPQMIGGTGGGSGGHDGVITAGSGGNGATPSGGGGGGAGNLSLNASGAGGNGANGQIIILEYF